MTDNPTYQIVVCLKCGKAKYVLGPCPRILAKKEYEKVITVVEKR